MFFNQTLQRVSAIPGVPVFVTDLPFGKVSGISFKVKLEQETQAHLTSEDKNFANYYGATPGLFSRDGNSHNRWANVQ